MFNTLKNIINSGFSINETMSGKHKFYKPSSNIIDVEQDIKFNIFWGNDSIKNFFDSKHPKYMEARLTGTIDVKGLCENSPCKGKLILDYFNRHTIRYDFDFYNNNLNYKFIGEKINIRPWNILTSHTTCFGVIIDSNGSLISVCKMFFDLKTIPEFIYSFRLR